MATTKGGIARGVFALEITSSGTNACRLCNGTTRIRVKTDRGDAGYLTSHYPDSVEFPDDPTKHPSTAHYTMLWDAVSPHGETVESNVDTVYFAAMHLMLTADVRRRTNAASH